MNLKISMSLQVFQDEREKHGKRLVGLRKGVDETQSALTVAQVEQSDIRLDFSNWPNFYISMPT